MVKRALFFSTPYSLSLRDNQMIIRTKEAPDMQRTVPVEDIGVVVLEDRQTSVTLPLLNALSDNNAAVIFCGDDRMPNAMLMNLDSNRTQGENYRTTKSRRASVEKKGYGGKSSRRKSETRPPCCRSWAKTGSG